MSSDAKLDTAVRALQTIGSFGDVRSSQRALDALAKIGIAAAVPQDVAGSTPANASTVAGSRMPEGERGVDPAETAGDRGEDSRKSVHFLRPLSAALGCGNEKCRGCFACLRATEARGSAEGKLEVFLDRLRTIVDEAFGMQPVLEWDELLDVLEKEARAQGRRTFVFQDAVHHLRLKVPPAALAKAMTEIPTVREAVNRVVGTLVETMPDAVVIDMQSRARPLELEGNHVHTCPTCHEHVPCGDRCAVEPDLVLDDGTERGAFVECASCAGNGGSHG